MKAAVLDRIAPIGTSPLALRNVPEPSPCAGEIRVRVRVCGICRTDLHVIEGDLPSRRNLGPLRLRVLRPKVTLFPLEEANRALQMLKADRISGSGVLVID